MYETSALKKIIDLQRNSFKFGPSKGATYIRGFAINFRPRSTRSKVGVRPIIEGRPILRNLHNHVFHNCSEGSSTLYTVYIGSSLSKWASVLTISIWWGTALSGITG